ncbi:MAG: hypothetical protein ACP5MH_10150 [Thermoproteus sp.]
MLLGEGLYNAAAVSAEVAAQLSVKAFIDQAWRRAP